MWLESTATEIVLKHFYEKFTSMILFFFSTLLHHYWESHLQFTSMWSLNITVTRVYCDRNHSKTLLWEVCINDCYFLFSTTLLHQYPILHLQWCCAPLVTPVCCIVNNFLWGRSKTELKFSIKINFYVSIHFLSVDH